MTGIESLMKGLPKVMSCKKIMVEKKLMVAKAHCPICEGKNTMRLRLAKQPRDTLGFHIRWVCSCGFRGME